MCPVCIATAALIAGKVTSSAGVAAIAIRKLGGKNAADDPVQLHLNRSEDEQSVPNSNSRRDEDVNDHD
jgi:hypothetical protein